MEQNPLSSESMQPAMRKGDARLLAIIALAYTALNLSISLVVFKDLYPMSIYPASVAFIMVYYQVKERLPGKRHVAIFLCFYQVVIIIGCVMMAMQNGLNAIDFSQFLEPVFFLPLVVIIFLIASALNHRQVIPRLYLACGLTFVPIAVFSLVPGNPIIGLLSQGYPVIGILSPASFKLVDATVPATLVISVHLWYHVPFVLGLAGAVAFILGYITIFGKKRIDNMFTILIVIGIIFSIYVVGVAFTWMLLRHSRNVVF